VTDHQDEAGAHSKDDIKLFMHNTANAQDAPQGGANAGKQLYLSTGCFYCHGRSGQGGAYND
jgi:mono/diheme cytochrome c family protein